ncbi:succinate dehydrogenase/fumarate reductase iron-sulfur subunit [bacterium BMS3Abin01]|nr:succinate dehydrogenase/fumarate reductase iron-sulfur subunit [bacterium BMS3Abin01]
MAETADTAAEQEEVLTDQDIVTGAKEPSLKPADVKAPELTGDIQIPHLVKGAMAKSKCHAAKPETMEAMGFPGRLVDNWEEAAVKKLGELLTKYKSLQVYLDICVRCGSCTDKCQFFLGSKDPKNMPVARADLLRKVYKKYFTTEGKIFGSLAGAAKLDLELLGEWYTYFHQCSQCRRCSVFCPYGIDTAEISMAAREIMDSIGIGQKYVNTVLVKLHEIGNNLGMNPKALKATMESTEEDIQEEDGVAVKLPVDQVGAEVLLITPSADFFATPHIESLIGYAKVFHQAGISWTLSSTASEAGNFGMFIGSYEHMQKAAMRIRKAIEELKPKRLIVGECGHAWRIAYAFWNTMIGPLDNSLGLKLEYPRPQHICEYTLDLVERGAIKLDKSANDDVIPTFHDSCNVARATRMGDRPGGQFEIPRALINAACNRYVEMDSDTIKEKTFCCGGGGGLLSDEILDVRVQGAMPRMQAYHAIKEENGANFFALICAICKAQFTKVFPKYGIPMIEVGGIHQLVAKAIELGAKE